MLQSTCLKDHINTFGIDQLLSNNDMFEQKCLQNIKELYKHAGKCDNQQKIKDILEAPVVSTPEGFTNNSPIYPMTPTPDNKTSARKSLCLFTNILDVEKKTAICTFGAAKSNCKSIKSGTTPWALKPKKKGRSKINDQVKKSLYNPKQVVQSTITNDFLKVNIDVHTEPQHVTEFLLRLLPLLVRHLMVQ